VTHTDYDTKVLSQKVLRLKEDRRFRRGEGIGIEESLPLFLLSLLSSLGNLFLRLRPSRATGRAQRIG
jgi:hypothetical protein